MPKPNQRDEAAKAARKAALEAELAELNKPVPIPYPRMLYRGAETVIVDHAVEEKTKLAEGWKNDPPQKGS